MAWQVVSENFSVAQPGAYLLKAEPALDEGTGCHPCRRPWIPGQTVCPSEDFSNSPPCLSGARKGKRTDPGEAPLTRVHGPVEGFLRASLVGERGSPAGPGRERGSQNWAGGQRGAREGFRRGGPSSPDSPSCPHVPRMPYCQVRGGPGTSRRMQTLETRRAGQGYPRGAGAEPPDAGTPLAGGWGREGGLTHTFRANVCF